MPHGVTQALAVPTLSSLTWWQLWARGTWRSLHKGTTCVTQVTRVAGSPRPDAPSLPTGSWLSVGSRVNTHRTWPKRVSPHPCPQRYLQVRQRLRSCPVSSGLCPPHRVTVALIEQGGAGGQTHPGNCAGGAGRGDGVMVKRHLVLCPLRPHPMMLMVTVAVVSPEPCP